MLRFQHDDGWTLIEHREHARLAGKFALHWNNVRFAPPTPFRHIRIAVSRHDDAWVDRDARPLLTKEGRPSAFSKELVGKYSAFEDIDLADYLRVRGRATEAVAEEDPYAAIVVSMHTVNLLSEQADLSRFTQEEKALHGLFLQDQRSRQRVLAEQYCALGGYAAEVAEDSLRRAFEFLQACDSLSLLACVAYPENAYLRHTHPSRDGLMHRLEFIPLGGSRYRVSPYPFDADGLVFEVPARTLFQSHWDTTEDFRRDYLATPPGLHRVELVR